jgi:hypothetical protein
MIIFITTIFYALCLPIVTEFSHLYSLFWNFFWNSLIRIQKFLVDLSWPLVAKLLKIINFESLKLLYDDISDSVNTDVCVASYLARAGTFEYLFIILTSIGTMGGITLSFILLLEEHVLQYTDCNQSSNPFAFRIFIYSCCFFAVYLLYLIVGYCLYILSSNFGRKNRFRNYRE